MLNDVDLMPTGRFIGEKGGFSVYDGEMARPWNYLYANEQILLRVTNYGLFSSQIRPPGGIMLFRTPSGENSLPFQIYIENGDKNEVMTAFLSPLNQSCRIGYECNFLPEYVEYVLTYRTLKVITRIGIADDCPAIWLKCRIENISGHQVDFSVLPAWRIAHSSASLEPWDMPEIYQSCGFFNAGFGSGVFLENRDPHGRTDSKSGALMAVDFAAEEVELDYRRFAGCGNMLAPAVLNKPLTLVNNREFDLFNPDPQFMNIARLSVGALRSGKISLEPNGSFDFSLCINHLEKWSDSTLRTGLTRTEELLTPAGQTAAAAALTKKFDDWSNNIKYTLPDKALENYLQMYLPWQLYWVGKLDRGWPTGMRGCRDAAQDYAGIALASPPATRQILLDILSCQKADGGFLRQFATSGPNGRHDARDYVDSGCWVIELLYDYLRLSGDMTFLDVRCRSLESAELTSVAQHIRKAIEYYLAAWNHGEHGLILMREGDWNDSLNSVGLEHRGESVMTSCQVVFVLKLLQEMFPESQEYYKTHAAILKENIRRHALAPNSFLRGAFNDDGHWLFSEDDPDGKCRINSAVNSWGVIAGIFEDAELEALFANLRSLRGPAGYRLFYPPLGVPPIPKAGRLGTGSLLPGLYENGTVYNHGSQGFLLRAAASAGQSSMLLDILKFSLPYDQARHPIAGTKSEPYGIVNFYYETPGHVGEGGTPFLSGTISTIYRAFFQNIMGVNARLDGIEFAPVLPAEWQEAECEFRLRGISFHLKVQRTANDGFRVNGQRRDRRTVSFSEFEPGGVQEIILNVN